MAVISSALRILGKLLSDARGVNAVQSHYGDRPVPPSSSLFPIPRDVGGRSTTTVHGAASSDEDDGTNPGNVTSLTPFCEWPVHMLQALEIFPSLPIPAGGLEMFIRVTADGVPRYSIEDLYQSFYAQLSDQEFKGVDVETATAQHKNHTPLFDGYKTIEDALRDRLVPYIHANRCLVSYASALLFVEGWTSVIEVATSLTAAVGTTGGAPTANEAHGHNGGGLLPSLALESAAAPTASSSSLAQFAHALSVEAILRYIQCSLAAIDVTSNFTVAAQDQMCTTLSRAVVALAGKLVQIAPRPTTTSNKNQQHHHADPSSAAIPQWNRTDAHRTMGALLNTMCLLGSRSALLRSDLYNALVMILSIPGFPLDPILLFRAQGQLFNLLLNDINELATPTLQLAAVNCLRTLLDISPQLCDAFCSGQHGAGGCAPTFSQFTASALAAVDEITLGTMQRYGSDGALAVGGGGSGSSSSAAADSATSSATILSSYILRGIFDIFCLASENHADAVYRSNAFLICNRLKLWAAGTRQTLDAVSGLTNVAGSNHFANSSHGPTASSSQQLSAASYLNHSAAHKLLQCVLSGVLRWYNASLRILRDHDEAVVQLADLVNSAKLVLQLAASPGAIQAVLLTMSSTQGEVGGVLSSHTGVGAHGSSGGVGAVDGTSAPRRLGAPLDASHPMVTYCAVIYEISELLLNFSQTSLIYECRELVYTFVVPNLVRELLSKDVQVALGTSSKLLLTSLKAVKNLVVFLVSVELSDTISGQQQQQQQSSSNSNNSSDAVVPLDVLCDLMQLLCATTTLHASHAQAGAAAAAAASSLINHQPPSSAINNQHTNVAAVGTAVLSRSGPSAEHLWDVVAMLCVDAMHTAALAISHRVAGRQSSRVHQTSESEDRKRMIDTVVQQAIRVVTNLREQRTSRRRKQQQHHRLHHADDVTFGDLTGEFQHDAYSSNASSASAERSLLMDRSLHRAEVAFSNLSGIIHARPVY